MIAECERDGEKVRVKIRTLAKAKGCGTQDATGRTEDSWGVERPAIWETIAATGWLI